MLVIFYGYILYGPSDLPQADAEEKCGFNSCSESSRRSLLAESLTSIN